MKGISELNGKTIANGKQFYCLSCVLPNNIVEIAEKVRNVRKMSKTCNKKRI